LDDVRRDGGAVSSASTLRLLSERRGVSSTAGGWGAGVGCSIAAAVNATGLTYSELIGSSFSMTKTKRSDRWATLSSTRRKHFAILQIGGFLGLGGRLVAVPYDSLKIDDTGERIEMPDSSKEELSKLTRDL
jgi:hypothetical protein